MESESELYWLKRVSLAKLIELGAPEESIFENCGGVELTQAELTKEQAHSLIPDGAYCYTHVDGVFTLCPFWDSIEQFPKQGNGYCHFMRCGDDIRGGFLWDQCKECGINDNDE
jgi:hypothetical protein